MSYFFVESLLFPLVKTLSAPVLAGRARNDSDRVQHSSYRQNGLAGPDHHPGWAKRIYRAPLHSCALHPTRCFAACLRRNRPSCGYHSRDGLCGISKFERVRQLIPSRRCRSASKAAKPRHRHAARDRPISRMQHAVTAAF